jgi:hypothetical protein
MTASTGPGPRRSDSTHLVLGCGIVATAALAGIWAPPNLVAILALLVLMRVCWLEDNICNDLIGRDRLPGSYVNTSIRRGNFLRLWFGMEPSGDAGRLPPHQLATAMRAESQIWACMLFGIGATLAAQVTAFGFALSLIASATLLAMALIRVDRLAVSLAHCAAGKALPQRLLLPTRRRVQDESD